MHAFLQGHLASKASEQHIHPLKTSSPPYTFGSIAFMCCSDWVKLFVQVTLQRQCCS